MPRSPFGQLTRPTNLCRSPQPAESNQDSGGPYTRTIQPTVQSIAKEPATDRNISGSLKGRVGANLVGHLRRLY